MTDVTTPCLANVWHWILIMHFHVTAEGLVNTYQEQEDFEGFKLACIVNFGIDTELKKKILKRDVNSLTDKLYNEAIENYQQHKEQVRNRRFLFSKISAYTGQPY